MEPVEGVTNPLAQLVHEVDPTEGAYVPTGQCVHGLSPLAEYEPAGQALTQCDNEIDPVESVFNPAGQEAQIVEDALFWYVPIAQGVQSGCRPVDE
jgi:hypothetical protein